MASAVLDLAEPFALDGPGEDHRRLRGAPRARERLVHLFDVVPVVLWGTHRVLPAGGQKARRFRTPIAMVVGETIPVGPGANPRETTDRIMAAMILARHDTVHGPTAFHPPRGCRRRRSRAR